MSTPYFPAEAPMLPLEGQSEVPPPPGLLGEIARFIYKAAPRPVPEIAIAGSIGFLAGIAGRAYNVSGTGLNHYVLALADTGTGKEAIKSGIDRIIAALTDLTNGGANAPLASSIVGPSDMASGQGLLRALSKRQPPCFVAIIGEFGLRFKQMADDRAHSADTALLRALLDLYHKSGHGSIVGETVYSEREKNTGVIVAPALSLIGESTPGTFYRYLNEGMIANGLLPRFNVIEYKGRRPRRNREAAFAKPDPELLERLAMLIAHCQLAAAKNQPTIVSIMPDADECLDQLDEYADDQINGSDRSINRELWNRAHLKALKLAALIAVGCNHEVPIITLQMAKWAREQVERDIRRLLDRFESGDVGDAIGSDAKQHEAVFRCIYEFVTSPFERIPPSYGVTAQMHASGVIPKTYLARRVLSMPAFKPGGTLALDRALKHFLEGDEIRELPKSQMIRDYGSAARSFAPVNHQRIIEAGRKKYENR
jgi:hypothetical protein